MQYTTTAGRRIKECSAGIFALLMALAPLTTRAIAPIGDNAELFITGTAGGQYNDNIFLSHNNAKSDYIFDLVPGLSYEFGKTNSVTTGQLAVSEDFQEFAKKSHLDNQLLNTSFWLKYDDSKTSLNFDASYHEADQAERTIQNLSYLVNRELAHVDGLGEIQITDKSSLGGGIVWDDTDYRQPNFTDWRYWQIPVNYYWKAEPKLDFSAGFQFQDNTVGTNGIDSREYFYNIGARGEFTPNLTGKVRIGYLDNELDNGKSDGGLGMDANLTYAYSPKSTVTFGMNDDFGYAATGGDYRDFGVYVGGNSSLTDQWSINGQLAYNRYSYVTSAQRDDFWTVRVGVAYIVSTNITLNGNYTYAEDNSNFSANSFKNNLFSVSATFHY